MSATSGLSASIHDRLLKRAKASGQDYNRLLERYALERFLYRLSNTSQSEQFVLKGALMMLIWIGDNSRPTRDADLLGYGDLSEDGLRDAFAEVCRVRVEPDGVTFDVGTIEISDIRKNDPYGGRRVTIKGLLGNARVNVQVDVGIGDAITPEPELIVLPTLLEFPAPKLRAYHPETAFSEKLQTVVALGMVNTRVKDYYDLWALIRTEQLDSAKLVTQIRATFERRNTAIPAETPVGLSDEFGTDAAKDAQWNAFMKKNDLSPMPFNDVIAQIRGFVMPVLSEATDGSRIHRIHERI